MLVSQTETSFNFIFVTYTEGNQKRRWTLPPKAFLVLEVVTLESGKHPALRGMYQGLGFLWMSVNYVSQVNMIEGMYVNLNLIIRS